MPPIIHRSIIIAKRWAWLMLLGISICGGVTYVVSKFIPPAYQASVVMVVNADPTSTETVTSSIAAVTTYAQLITNPVVLDPVLANHPGMTLQQLKGMISTKAVSGTQLIDMNVTSGNPRLAKQISDEVSHSFAQYVNSQLPGAVQVLPARMPDAPVSPRPLLDAGIGALVGLSLAIAMIVVFEWLADRLAGPAEVQKLLETEILMDIPRLSNTQLNKEPEEILVMAEECHNLCHMLDTIQASKHFKSIMVTSALQNEGKSTIAKHVAAFLALEGKRVLLVDANIHHPIIHQAFHLGNQRGFSDVPGVMSGRFQIEHYIQTSEIPNLYVMTVGTLPPGYVQFSQSQQANQLFKAFNQAPFDYILFDAPALLAATDTRLLAWNMQATILVVDPFETPRKALLRAAAVLNRTGTTLLGVVVNKSYWSDSRDMYPPANPRRLQTDVPDSVSPDQPARSPVTNLDDTIRLNHRLPVVKLIKR